MTDFVLVQRELDSSGAIPRVLAVRASFVRVTGSNFVEAAKQARWTEWVQIGSLVEGAKPRERFMVSSADQIRVLMTSRLDLSRLLDQEQQTFRAIVKLATAQKGPRR